MINSLKEKASAYIEKANQLEAFKSPEALLSLSLQVLLVIFLMYMNDNGYLSIFMPVILFPGILFKELRHNKLYWVLILLFGATFYLILDLVGYVPNHKHIFAYLILAALLSLFAGSPEKSLDSFKIQSRYIIGLCFLFATIGKFLAPEFLNSAFFDFTNTTDPRFFGSTSIFGGIEPQLLKDNEDTFFNFLRTSNVNDSFVLNGADKIEGFSSFLTYWTIFIEGMIGISFLTPSRFKLSKMRNVFLVVFILTTYPIATVTGFAIILAFMGFMQSLSANWKLTGYSLFYLLVLLLLPLNYFPFTRLFAIFS